MRAVRTLVTTATVAAIFASAGCANTVEVSQGQVEAWQEQADQTLPLATQTRIDARNDSCVFGRDICAIVAIDVHFPSSEALAASEEPMRALYERAAGDMNGLTVPELSAFNDEQDAWSVDAGVALSDTVVGVSGAEFLRQTVLTDDAIAPELYGLVRLYVADPRDITPEALEQAADFAAGALAEVGGDLTSIQFLQEGSAAVIPVSDLPTFEPHEQCLQTASLALNVSYASIVVSPVDSPLGACLS